MKYTKFEMDPLAKSAAAATNGTKAVVSGSNDFYGANSLETFSSASGLGLTHEDAQGFLDYPTSFGGKAANYWRKDSGVQVWAYEETFDNWQDTFGMDAVMVFYHSGHGNMDSKGVFQAPLGAKWDNRDWVFSNNMAFSNEDLRYLFWSTCLSIRVSGPDNPVRTWWDPNKGGLRMMFGYETTSVDHAGYGSFFWDEWKKGKTFARAFLDASWRISHNQVPVVLAVGSDQQDAVNRLNTERLFSKAPIGKGWYQWQWIGTLPTRSFANKVSIPKDVNDIELADKYTDDARVSKIARETGVTSKGAGSIALDGNGNRLVISKDVQVAVNQSGALNVHFGSPNAENTSLLSQKKAIKIAQGVIKSLDMAKDIEITLGNIRHRLTCGGTLNGSATVTDVTPLETIVQFRQTHNGVESVNSDHGLIAISVDNDGRVVNVYDSTRAVLGELGNGAARQSSPRDPKKSSGRNIEATFKRKVHRLGEGNGRFTVLREKVGYDFSANLGIVVHQKDVEVNLGRNLKKRYKLRVPVLK